MNALVLLSRKRAEGQGLVPSEFWIMCLEKSPDVCLRQYQSAAASQGRITRKDFSGDQGLALWPRRIPSNLSIHVTWPGALLLWLEGCLLLPGCDEPS